MKFLISKILDVAAKNPVTRPQDEGILSLCFPISITTQDIVNLNSTSNQQKETKKEESNCCS
jgi:hypothetical protein